MKVFVTGVAGQLGHDVMNELNKRGYEGIGSDIAPEYSGVQDGSAVTTMPYISLDITDKEAVEKVLTKQKPDVVVHCAAWTAVDLAEDDDKVAKVRAINAGGTENIAKVCKKIDSKMVYISTDYVFDGQGTKPWVPDCTDYKPLNVYGQTKLEGEQAVSSNLDKYFIVRIAWVFGMNGKNFIKTMLNVGKRDLPDADMTEAEENTVDTSENKTKKIVRTLFPKQWQNHFGCSSEDVVLLHRVKYCGNWDVLRPAKIVEGMGLISENLLEKLNNEAHSMIEKMGCAV